MPEDEVLLPPPPPIKSATNSANTGDEVLLPPPPKKDTTTDNQSGFSKLLTDTADKVNANEDKIVGTNKDLMNYQVPDIKPTQTDKATQATENPMAFQGDLQDNPLGQTSNPKMKSLFDAFDNNLKTTDYYDKTAPYTNSSGSMQLA